MTFTQSFPLLAIAALFSLVGCANMRDRSEGATDQAAQEKRENKSVEQVNRAGTVLQKMSAEPGMRDQLALARGVFIVPRYGRAGLGIGAQGGEGIVLLKQASGWSDPAFYNFGGLSAGLLAGAEGGSMIFLLNNERAVSNFMKQDNFSVSADAGLTIVNWSAKGQADLSRADVIAWTDTRGLFGSAAIGIRDVRFDSRDSEAFYGRSVALNDILMGRVTAPQEKVSTLKQLLPEGPAMTGGATSGESSGVEDSQPDK
jgi:lipid-binding SYLF domain-containing protein